MIVIIQYRIILLCSIVYNFKPVELVTLGIFNYFYLIEFLNCINVYTKLRSYYIILSILIVTCVVLKENIIAHRLVG